MASTPHAFLRCAQPEYPRTRLGWEGATNTAATYESLAHSPAAAARPRVRIEVKTQARYRQVAGPIGHLKTSAWRRFWKFGTLRSKVRSRPLVRLSDDTQRLVAPSSHRQPGCAVLTMPRCPMPSSRAKRTVVEGSAVQIDAQAMPSRPAAAAGFSSSRGAPPVFLSLSNSAPLPSPRTWSPPVPRLSPLPAHTPSHFLPLPQGSFRRHKF